MDWCVGELLDHLKAEGLLEDTLIIFSSDNGPVLDDGYLDDSPRLNKMCMHKPAGPLRGGKYSKFEGGSRIPLIVSWASHIRPQTSSALVSQVDFVASFAAMLGVDLGDGAPDSLNMLDVLLGESHIGREEILAEAINKSHFLRQGKWTYLQPCKGNAVEYNTDIELGSSLDPQLYNMDYDIGQRENVAQLHMDLVAKMDRRIEEIKAGKRAR